MMWLHSHISSIKLSLAIVHIHEVAPKTHLTTVHSFALVMQQSASKIPQFLETFLLVLLLSFKTVDGSFARSLGADQDQLRLFAFIKKELAELKMQVQFAVLKPMMQFRHVSFCPFDEN